MKLFDIIKENYETTVGRGLISHKTTIEDFICKIYEESDEFKEAVCFGDADQINHELADIILTCLNIANHFNIDIEKQLIKNIKKNKER